MNVFDVAVRRIGGALAGGTVGLVVGAFFWHNSFSMGPMIGDMAILCALFGAALGVWWMSPSPERPVAGSRHKKIAMQGDGPCERHFAPEEDESLPQLAFLFGRSLRPFARLLRPQRHALPLVFRVAHSALGGLLLGWCFHAALVDAPFLAAQRLTAMLIASLAAGLVLGIAWALSATVELAAVQVIARSVSEGAGRKSQIPR